jgi:hypothetical protein
MVVSCSIVDSTKLRQVKRMEEPFGPKDTGPRREKKKHPSITTFSGVWLKKRAFRIQARHSC